MELVSKSALAVHREYLRTLNLRHSLFEKSYPTILGKPLDDYKSIYSIPRNEREELYRLKGEILAHRLYFSSFFGDGRKAIITDGFRERCTELKYRILCDSLCSDGFLIIFTDGGRVEHYAGQNYHRLIEKGSLLLALDLCEHAYFYDYGFDKESYVKKAVSMMDFRKK